MVNVKSSEVKAMTLDDQLLKAAENGDIDAVKSLIEQGALIDYQDTASFAEMTPLLLACYHGHVPVVEYLLQRGAQLHCHGSIGYTALMHASMNGYVAIIRLLVGAGANIDQTDYGGWTAFHYACKYGNVDAALLLIELGADASIKDKIFNETALEMMMMKDVGGKLRCEAAIASRKTSMRPINASCLANGGLSGNVKELQEQVAILRAELERSNNDREGLQEYVEKLHHDLVMAINAQRAKDMVIYELQDRLFFGMSW